MFVNLLPNTVPTNGPEENHNAYPQPHIQCECLGPLRDSGCTELVRARSPDHVRENVALSAFCVSDVVFTAFLWFWCGLPLFFLFLLVFGGLSLKGAAPGKTLE